MKQTPARVPDLTPFITAFHLRPTIESVVEHNVARLHASGQPVATINPYRTRCNILSDKHINLYGCFILGVNTLYVTCI